MLTAFAGTHTRRAASPLCPTCLRPLLKSYVLEGIVKMNRILVIFCLLLAVAQFLVGSLIYNFSGLAINSFSFSVVSYSALSAIYLLFLIYQAFKLSFASFSALALTSIVSIFLGHVASFIITGSLMTLSNYLFDYALVIALSIFVLWLYRALRKT